MIREEIKNDMHYLLSKVNWGDSAMDAKAIKILNELPTKIDQLLEPTEEEE